MGPEPYLVLFVADAAGDEHAAELAQLASAAAQLHSWTGPEPRFFDAVPAETQERTVGIALRVPQREDDDAHAVAALVHACAAAGNRLGVRIEVQFREQRLGHLRDGTPEPAVVDAIREQLGIDLQ